MGLAGEAVAATEMVFQAQRAEGVEAGEAEPEEVPVGAVASEALVSAIARITPIIRTLARGQNRPLQTQALSLGNGANLLLPTLADGVKVPALSRRLRMCGVRRHLK